MKKSRLAGLTGLFLSLMLLFTALSRAADSAGIANVTLVRPQNMMIAHEVSGTGRVEQNQERAVVTEAGQRVKAIHVKEGQQVEEGELLFELDMDFLEESVLEQKQEIHKLEFQKQDADSQESVSAQRHANGQAQAAEDYSLSTTRASATLAHARANLEDAKKALKDYRKQKGTSTESTLAQEQLEQICEQRSAEYIQAQQDLQTLQWRIEKAVDDALNKARQGNAADVAPKGQENAAAIVPNGQENVAAIVPNGQVKTGSGDPEPEIVIEEIQQEDAGGFSEPGGSLAMSGEADLLLPDGDTGDGDQSDLILPDGGTGDGSKSDLLLPGGDTGDGSQSDLILPDGSAGVGSQSDLILPGEDTWTGGSQVPTQEELDQIEQQVRSGYAEQLAAARQAVDDALAAKQEAEAALSDYQQKMLASLDAQSAGQEKQYIDAVKAAQASYEDAAIAANEASVRGNREIQTAGIPDAYSSTSDIYQLDLDQMEMKLSKLEKLQQQKGKITSPVDGIVLSIAVTVGEKTPDGMAVMLADLTKGCRMSVQIPQEQEMYVGRGDPATVKSGDGKTVLEEIPVESVASDAKDESVCLVTVQIPDGTLQPGALASLSLTKKSPAYPLCIPLGALHIDEKNQTYVLAVQETNSVLGTEMEAYRIPVTVEERNDSYAALAQGAVSSSQEVIASSDRELSEGSRVRIRN